MIVFRFCKLNGAEFIPHLDILRHIQRTLRRMGLKVNYSQGFNPHMLVYLSSPLPLGLKSESEFCVVDADGGADGFVEKFNSCTHRGIKCLEAYTVEKKPNVAADITAATYVISGLNAFDPYSILNGEDFILTDKKGRRINAREKIEDLRFLGGDLVARLKFGGDGLRADILVEELKRRFGGEHPVIVKKEAHFLNGLRFEEYIKAYHG